MDIIRLTRELAELRSRVEALEAKGGARTPAAPAAPPPSRSIPVPGPARPSDSGPSFSSSQLLGFVAVACFVLAASFLIKLAVDSGWLTPLRQLGLAVLFGLTLVAAGLAWAEHDLPYISLLPGAGIVVLFMSAFAGCLHFGLYGPWQAALAAGAVSLLSLGLFKRFRQDFYVVVAVVGTYLSPLLLPELKVGSFDTMVFYVVWDFTFATLSIALGSRMMLVLAGYLSLGVFAAATPAASGRGPELWPIVAFEAVQFSIFSCATALYSMLRDSPLTLDEAWASFPLLLFFYGLEYAWLKRLVPEASAYIALAFSGFVYTLYALAQERIAQSRLRSGAFVHAFVALVLFHAGYLDLLPDRWAAWTALAVLGVLWLLSSSLEPSGRHVGYFLAAGLVVSINYGRILFTEPYPVGEVLVLNLLFAAALGAVYLSGKAELGTIALFAADIQAMAGLQRLAGRFHLPPGWGEAERFITTVLWAWLGVGLLLWAARRKDDLLSRSAVLVLGVAAFKGLVFDVAAQQPVVRIVCLLALGVSLYFSGFVLRKQKSPG